MDTRVCPPRIKAAGEVCQVTGATSRNKGAQRALVVTRFIWRYRDSEDAEWGYSEVPVNPEKYEFVECFELKYSYADGRHTV